MVTQTKKPKGRLSITIESTLVALIDEIVKETNTNRSFVISHCLEEFARKRKDNLMIEYYETMAKEDDRFAKDSVKVIQNIAASWSD